jgi:uncharacterized membrane protein
MVHYLIQFGSVLVAFVVIDAVWLGVVMRRFYSDQLGLLMRDQVQWPAAIAFYVLYAICLTVLALAPADRSGSWTTAAVLGAMVGLAAYGTYNLTNLATIRGFPTTLALVDLAWGTVLTAVAATVGWLIARAMQG